MKKYETCALNRAYYMLRRRLSNPTAGCVDYETDLLRFFAHREAAAFFALSRRAFALMLLALALPPLSPPSRPNATAAGFFPSSGFGFGSSPVNWRTMENAPSLMSCFLPDRFGMIHLFQSSGEKANP
jgi:hypothetical protein